MATPNDKNGAPPREVHVEPKAINWLAWIALALGVLALLVALGRCSRENVVTTPVDNGTAAVAPTVAPVVAPLAGTTTLGTYLAGSDAAPRSFVFERLHFASADSKTPLGGENEIGTIAAALKQYATTRVRVDGYADSRGSDAANMALGKARAETVKSALVAQGIAATRIDTATGGENDPVDTNATAQGQAENRRTELVVVQR